MAIGASTRTHPFQQANSKTFLGPPLSNHLSKNSKPDHIA